jgi:hypothetical protein
MSPHQAIAVAARLFAVWLLIHLPGQAYAFFADQSRLSDPRLRLITLSVVVVELVVILAFWMFPDTIARTLLRSSSAEPPAPSSADAWLSLGCALMGLWLLATSLPALVVDVFAWSSMQLEERSFLWRSVFYDFSQVAIGVWLTLGARGFRRLVWWARNPGVAAPSADRSREP